MPLILTILSHMAATIDNNSEKKKKFHAWPTFATPRQHLYHMYDLKFPYEEIFAENCESLSRLYLG